MSSDNATTATRLQPIVSQPLPLDSIVCGDNVATMATFPDASIDLVVTSPPYDNLRTYGGHTWDFEGVAQQLWRVIKPGGVVVWVVADATIDGSETGTSFRQALRFMEIGFRLHDTMIYCKYGCNFPQSNRYGDVFEFMFVLSNGTPRTANLIQTETTGHSGSTVGSKQRGTVSDLKRKNGSIQPNATKPLENVWLIAAHGRNPAKDDAVAFHHPAIFPEALARDHILSWSNEGDLVLDPFNGSGTTSKMARLMGRRFIGIDVNESYCEIARKRLAQKLLDFDCAG